jgi:hypothetical protein
MCQLAGGAKRTEGRARSEPFHRLGLRLGAARDHVACDRRIKENGADTPALCVAPRVPAPSWYNEPRDTAQAAEAHRTNVFLAGTSAAPEEQKFPLGLKLPACAETYDEREMHAGRSAMTAAINEKLLEDRLGTLEAARSWSPRVVSRLEALIRSGEDEALFRVNPIKFAADKGMAEAEAIDLFLYAAAAVRDELDEVCRRSLFSVAVDLTGRTVWHHQRAGTGGMSLS